MNKYIKIIIIVLVVFIVLYVLTSLITPNMDKKISDYLQKQGYKVSNDDVNLYVKTVNDTTYTFSLAGYTYKEEIEEKISGVLTSLNATYTYKDDSLIYTYRMNDNTNMNVLFKGTYNDKNFICEKEFSTASFSDNEKKSICDLIEIRIKNFNLEAKTLFASYEYIDYMKNN